jgi:hypothetical protein
MNLHLKHWVMGIALLQAISFSVIADTEIIGRVGKITVKNIEIDGKNYPLLKGESEDLRARVGEVTECREKYRMTCGTLAGVGYIDKARVTIRNGIAMRIEVLELQQ